MPPVKNKSLLLILFLCLGIEATSSWPAVAGEEKALVKDDQTPAESRQKPGTQLIPTNEALLQTLFVGIFINSRFEKDGTIYREKNEYWIPFPFFLEMTGLKEDGRTGSVARYSTSIGAISFDTASLRTINALPCISFSELKKVFYITAAFNQPLFAAMLAVPWAPGSPQKLRQKTDLPVDIKAPESSISFIGIEAQGTYDFDSTFKKYLLLETSGRLAGGIWDVTANGDPQSGFSPSSYHWTAFNSNLALRLGTGYSGSYSLIGSQAVTGLQIGWNNRSILKQLDAEQHSSSDIFLNIDNNQSRTIEGFGPPATIAELRFDGEVFSRLRIGLDGRFAFPDVRMTSDLRKTEVYIYERSINEKPIKVIDFSQSVSNRALPGGELLVRGGLGQTGNPFSQQPGATGSTAAFAHILYGLSDRISLETAVQQNTGSGVPDLLAGTILSPGANWNAALYGASSNRNYGSDIRLEGHYKYWATSYWGRFRQPAFGSDNIEKYLNHSFRWTATPERQLSLQLIGHYEKQGDSWLSRYLLPAGSLFPFSWLSFSATPDEEQNYRYEAGVRLGNQSNLRAIYHHNIASADYLQEFNERLNIRFLHDYAINTKGNLSNMVIDWYPRSSKNDLLETAFSYSKGNAGITGSWSHYVNSGLRVAMQYSYNMNNATSLNLGNIVSAATTQAPQKYASLSLSWDLGWSNKGLFPVNRNAITLTRGGIAGSLDIENETRLSAADVNNISILLNGRNMQQRQIDGSFFVGSLKPGIYNLSVDPEKLPIELVVDQKVRVIEVKNGAVTGVKIPIYAEFGASGLVTDTAGNSLANVVVLIAGKENKTTVRVVTNEFGYYRTDRLRSGSYVISAESVNNRPVATKKQPFTIKDDYLFDLNLIIEPPSKAPITVPPTIEKTTTIKTGIES